MNMYELGKVMAEKRAGDVSGTPAEWQSGVRKFVVGTPVPERPALLARLARAINPGLAREVEQTYTGAVAPAAAIPVMKEYALARSMSNVLRPGGVLQGPVNHPLRTRLARGVLRAFGDTSVAVDE